MWVSCIYAFILRQSRYAKATSITVQIAQKAKAGLMKYSTKASARLATDMAIIKSGAHFSLFIKPYNAAM